MRNFGTSTKNFSTTCPACSERVEFTHTGPLLANQEAITRQVCQACQSSFIARFPRPDGKPARKQHDRSNRIQVAILDTFAEQGPPMTVRQIFYQLSSKGVVPKDETKGYRPVQSQLTVMRRNGSIPYGWLADNTRWKIQPTMYNGMSDALERMTRYYRQDLWASQNAHVEIWIEKDALAGVVSSITDSFGVPLFVSRGYSSISFAFDAAEQLSQLNKPIYIYHFGDFDADGVHAAHSIREELSRHYADFHFERAAITPAHIDYYNLLTRPQKKSSPRYKWWRAQYGDAQNAELDALPANVLRGMVRDCIERHINPYEWERTKAIEAAERKSLQYVLDSVGAPNNLGE